MTRRFPRLASRHSAVLLLSAALGGCINAGPDYEAVPVPSPQDWAAAHGGDASLVYAAASDAQRESVLQGFALFEDAQLLALQGRALENNPDLQTALLRFAQSRVQYGAIAKQTQPLFGFGAGVSRQAQSESGSAARLLSALSAPQQREQLLDFISDPFTLYQAGFDASWELDLWGRVSRSIEAADAQMQMAAAATEQVQLALLSEVARHYFQLRGVQEQLVLLQADTRRNEELLQLLTARTAAGLASAVEQLRQEARLAQLRSREPQLLEQEAQLRNGLSLLLGAAPGSLQGTLNYAQTWVLRAMPSLALGVPAEIVNTRPDIQAAEQQLRAASAQIGVAQAQLYPSITLGAGFGLETLFSGELNSWGAQQWSLGPQLSLPLFDQGRRQSVLQVRELQAQEAAIAYQTTVLRAWHEVDSALSGYTAQQQVHTQLQAQLAHSEQAFALAQTQFSNGLVNYLLVLEYEQNLANARRELSDSATRMAVNLVGLLKAVGHVGPIPGLQPAA